MSSNTSLVKTIGLPLFAFIALAAANGYVDKKTPSLNNGDRKVASLKPEANHRHSLQHTTKLAHSIEISLSKEVLTQDNHFLIKAVVVSPNEISNIDYQWKLADGIVHLSGELNNLGQALQPNTAYEYVIEVKSEQSINHQVFFIANSKDSSKPFYHSQQFNTLDEESLAVEKQEIFVRANEYEAQQKTIYNKIFK